MIILLTKKSAEYFGLIDPDFQGEQTTGVETGWRPFDQSSHDFITARSSKKRNFRIMQHLAREKMSISRGNVWKIRDD